MGSKVFDKLPLDPTVANGPPAGPSAASTAATVIVGGKQKAGIPKATLAGEQPSATPRPATSQPGGVPRPFQRTEPGVQSRMRFVLAVCCSMVVHMAFVVILGLSLIPPSVHVRANELIATALDERPDELLNQVLPEDVDPSRELALVSSSRAVDGSSTSSNREPAGAGSFGVSTPQFDRSLTEKDTPYKVHVGDITEFSKPGNHFSMDLPEGTLGEPQAVVDDYAQAMDRITQEILAMLAKSKVLVIWCYDQSVSMKDDQQEIRDRIQRVYEELGLADSAQGDALLTAVTSFGENFMVHTPKPTYDIEEIRAAIASVPTDETGMEMMCSAVKNSIGTFHKFSTSGRRQLALILVTDESGDPGTNVSDLEGAIREARDARCPVYTLGREAVFGYPYAFMSWTDPETKLGFWLQIDRGPETPFPEQLQIDGFQARYDAHPSGFGPFEQVRISRETGGVFFMLPSPETNLVRGDNRKYELQAMRPYLPDLSPRDQYEAERNQSELRSTLWKIISDLNPYNPKHVEHCQVPVTFPIKPEDFFNAAKGAYIAADGMVEYIHEAEQAMDRIRPLRHREPSPRWRANYDLMYGQLIAYKVRLFEYKEYLKAFAIRPKVIKNPNGPTAKTNYWGVTTRAETITGEVTAAYIRRSTELFEGVVYEHPGTPWAARAQWELARGFGVELVEGYSDPRSRAGIKVPKL